MPSESSISKRLAVKARLEYEKALKEIPIRAHYWGAQRGILNAWVAQGVARGGSIDSSFTTPYYLKLKLGPTDRMEVEVPLFVEWAEETFALRFHEVAVIEDAVKYSFKEETHPISLLSLFFTPHKRSTCTIIQEEVGERVVKEYKPRIVCA